MRIAILLSCGALATGTIAAADNLAGNETWGGRRAHPAVVNSVTALADDPNTLSLRGTWDFVPTPSGNRRNTPWSYVFKGTGSFWSGKPQWGGKGCYLYLAAKSHAIV